MKSFEVFSPDGETFYGARMLWEWEAASMRARGFIVVEA